MSDDIVIRLRMSAGLMEGFPHMKARSFNREWIAEAADEIDRLRVCLATAERHLRIVSVHRGTPAANRILDYWLPLTELAEDALDD